MKKLFLSQLMLLLFVPLFIMSCGDDDNPAPIELIPEMDGLYVFGTNTVAETALEPEARMSLAILNPGKSGGVQTKEGYYAKLMYIGANSEIQITQVEGDDSFIYGAENGGTISQGPDELQFTDISDTFIHGELLAGGAPIEVSEEGLYYLFVNTVENTFRLMRVEANLIGDATPGQWSSSTSIPMIHSSADSTVFEINGLELQGESGYKVRFNEGYEVFNNNEIATLSFLGVESYGTAWDTGINDLGYWDENIPNKETGTYTYRLKYNAETGEWSETKIRDYSTTKIGLFGNAYYKSPGVQGDWTDPYGVKAPAKEGNTFTWTWDNVELVEGGEFVILENGTWGGMAVLYNDATVREGAAFTNNQITQGTGSENFLVSAGGFYDITLTINVETGVRTLTINPAN